MWRSWWISYPNIELRCLLLWRYVCVFLFILLWFIMPCPSYLCVSGAISNLLKFITDKNVKHLSLTSEVWCPYSSSFKHCRHQVWGRVQKCSKKSSRYCFIYVVFLPGLAFSNIKINGNSVSFLSVNFVATDESLPAIFYFTAAWCGPCKFYCILLKEIIFCVFPKKLKKKGKRSAFLYSSFYIQLRPFSTYFMQASWYLQSLESWVRNILM